MPFGVCTEPSNVKAAGKACPYRFTCLGCGHFRSDPSYLPELKGYLQQMLADRECHGGRAQPGVVTRSPPSATEGGSG